MKTVIALIAGLMLPASLCAQYTAQVVGFGPGNVQTSALTLNPGDSFSGAVVLTGPTGVRNDSAVFRLVFSMPGLLFSPGWYQWGSPYPTGGPDDATVPLISATGAIQASTYLDSANPGAVDLGFENITPSFGDYFLTGQLLRFTFRVPVASDPTIINIRFADGSFTNGASSIGVAVGDSLTLTVVPAPAAAALGLVGCSWFGRRSRRR